MDKIIKTYARAVFYMGVVIMIGALFIFGISYNTARSFDASLKENAKNNERNLNYIYQQQKLINSIQKGTPQVKALMDMHFSDSIKIIDLQNKSNVNRELLNQLKNIK